MWQIAPELRAMVKFRQFNLLSDFSTLRYPALMASTLRILRDNRLTVYAHGERIEA